VIVNQQCSRGAGLNPELMEQERQLGPGARMNPSAGLAWPIARASIFLLTKPSSFRALLTSGGVHSWPKRLVIFQAMVCKSVCKRDIERWRYMGSGNTIAEGQWLQDSGCY